MIKSVNPGAVGLVVTEFISVEGLTRNNVKSQLMLRFKEVERPISIQIFGYDIERMINAAKMVEDAGAEIVDINCGCPVPKVVRRGGGCELMRQPDHLARIVESVSGAVKIPVTVKIRAGWDESSINAPDVGRRVESAGAKLIAVHGRTRVQMYRGEADWGIVSAVQSAVHIPVVGSGDVVDRSSAQRFYDSGAAGLMIGRGAMYNPWIFSELSEGKTSSISRRNELAAVDFLLKYIDEAEADEGERGAVTRVKQISGHITRGLRDGAEFRNRLCHSSSLQQTRAILLEWASRSVGSGEELGERIGV
jgi:tRNA-dihydrouridine synthase B